MTYKTSDRPTDRGSEGNSECCRGLHKVLVDGWDVGAIAAFFAMSNRLAGLGAMRPNDEFYAMGR